MYSVSHNIRKPSWGKTFRPNFRSTSSAQISCLRSTPTWYCLQWTSKRFLSSTSSEQPACYYLQTLMKTVRPVAVSPANHVKLLSATVSLTVGMCSRGRKWRLNLSRLEDLRMVMDRTFFECSRLLINRSPSSPMHNSLYCTNVGQ